MKQSKEFRQTKKLLSFLSKKRRVQFNFILILMIFGSLSEVASIGLVIPFLGALTTPEIIYQNQFLSPIFEYFKLTSPEQLLLPFTAMFIVAVVISGIIRLTLLYVTIRFSNAIGHDFGINVYRRTLYQSYSAHANQNSSEIVNGVILKVNLITGGVIKPLLNILSTSLIMIGIITTLLIIDMSTSLAALGGFSLIYFLVIKYTRKSLQRNSQHIAQYSTLMIKSLQEGLGGIRDIIIDGTQNFFCKIFGTSDLALRKASGVNLFIAGSPRYIMEALGMTLIAVLAYSLRVNTSDFNYVIPTLGAFALGAQRLLPTMQLLYDSYTSIRGVQASLTDVLKLLNQKLPDYIDKPLTDLSNIKNNIVLKNMSFRYSNDLPLVLDNINLSFKKGSRIGFAGVTGSGKSTLLDILMGLISPSSGQLLVDNKVIEEKNLSGWWRNIAHVPQSIYLSDSTIEENIAFGIDKGDIDLSKVKQAAKFAQIHSFIIEMPEGYKTHVGERGVRLSGGQRQRLGIARALYKGVDVLMLDEATSSLDNTTESAVMDSINSLDKGLTVFIIAHRLTTLKECDIIHVLDKGKIIKTLSYDELLKDTDLLKLRVE